MASLEETRYKIAGNVYEILLRGVLIPVVQELSNNQSFKATGWVS
jgi:hypothetical protein